MKKLFSLLCCLFLLFAFTAPSYSATSYSTIQLRRGTAAQWTAANPVLTEGEPGFETDTGKFKIGDGLTHWNSLYYRPRFITDLGWMAKDLVTPINPPSGYHLIYPKADDNWYSMNTSGVETLIGSGGGGSMTWPGAGIAVSLGVAGPWDTSVKLGTLTNTYLMTYSTADGIQAVTSPSTYQTALTFPQSVINTDGAVTLLNDSASPGNFKLYGTTTGALGFQAQTNINTMVFPVPGTLATGTNVTNQFTCPWAGNRKSVV